MQLLVGDDNERALATQKSPLLNRLNQLRVQAPLRATTPPGSLSFRCRVAMWGAADCQSIQGEFYSATDLTWRTS